MRKIGILGVGRAGRSLLEYLWTRPDVRILLYDENPQAFNHRRVAFALREGKANKVDDPSELTDADLLIKSPGIPESAEWIRNLDEAGTRMVDEVEYTWRELGEPLTVAVTGTNGKSTTTAWIARVLKSSGRKAFCGGNISPGRPFSEALTDKPYQVYVVEVSSFQLERCPTFRPHVGVLLNITEDHLDRHSLSEYAGLKMSLFKNHQDTDYAVLNADDEVIRERMSEIKGRQLLYSLKSRDAHAYLDEGILFLNRTRVIEASQLPLPGIHNVQNALATCAVAGVLGAEHAEIERGLKKFKGLAHRMQYLGTLEGRKVYNNSMCTNPVAFYNSVHAFDDKSVVIAGGTEKGLPLGPFIKGVKEKAEFVVLFGTNAEKLKGILQNEIPISSCVTAESLRAALQAALSNSKFGQRILFSPGFASFGNFRNFEERGNAFIRAFGELGAKT